MSRLPALAVVVVAHDSAADLERTLPALTAQLREDDEVVVVDSGSGDGSADVARRLLGGAAVLDAGGNVGFARGCHLGVAATTAPLVLLLNPDCTPQPGCVEELRRAAHARPHWGAWQALVTLPGGERVNSAGNPVHFLGFAWAGGHDEPLGAAPAEPAEVGSASGAALVVRRGAWTALGGFDERYFMYGEDVDLSLRLRLAGWWIGLVPSARVVHEYAFAKGDYKWFRLERNRWWTILGTYPGPLLALVLPALLAFEVLLLAGAASGGWLGAKLRAQAAVLRELPRILERRRAIQARAKVTPIAFAGALVASLDSPYLAAARRIPLAERVLALYWRAVLAALRRSSTSA